MTVGRYQYVVVRYVPNVLRDEAVNVGVLARAVEAHEFDYRFLPRSATVRQLWPGADRRLVRNFESQLAVCREAGAPLGNLGHPSESEFFHRARAEFNGTLQLSPVRGTTANSLDDVIEWGYQTFLSEPGIGARPINYQTIAPYQLRARLWNAFERRDLFLNGRVERQPVVSGKHAPWTFDLGYRNGSFNLINTLALNAAAPEANLGRALVLKGMVDDVKSQHAGPVQGVAVVQQSAHREAATGYSEANSLLADAGIHVYEIGEVRYLVQRVEDETAAF
jgi:hypothetical protein